jgi:TPR repeat protein
MRVFSPDTIACPGNYSCCSLFCCRCLSGPDVSHLARPAADRHQGRADASASSPESIAEFAETRRVAETGDAEAQLELARMLQLGVGTPQDTAQSMAWIRKSAESGYAPAQSALGLACTVGGKVPVDRVQGEYWLRKGVAQGDALAQTILALEFIDGGSPPEEQALAITWLKKAALEEHFIPAYNALGEHLMRAATDEQERGEAFHWYDRAAREQEPAGMRNVARAHELGLGWYSRTSWPWSGTSGRHGAVTCPPCGACSMCMSRVNWGRRRMPKTPRNGAPSWRRRKTNEDHPVCIERGPGAARAGAASVHQGTGPASGVGGIRYQGPG